MAGYLQPEEKIALVTGSARRIGRAIALRLADRGYALYLHYNTSETQVRELQHQIDEAGGKSWMVQADLTDPVQIEALFHQIESSSSYLDVLVNCAAVMTRGDWASQSVEAWDSVMNLNLRAPWLCARRAAALMRSDGVIINISDAGVGNLWPNYLAYSISKNGLEMLTRLLAKSLAPRIRVNAVAPGLSLPVENFPSDKWQRLVRRLPLQRESPPEDIAAAVLALVDNPSITGQILAVDSGYTLI